MTSRSLPCIVLVALSTLYLVGCGTSSPNCENYTADITPITATLDHTKTGNSQTYSTIVTAPTGCALPPLPSPVWTVSNTDSASITQSGVASCLAAATLPITVSAGKSYNTATLVCE